LTRSAILVLMTSAVLLAAPATASAGSFHRGGFHRGIGWGAPYGGLYGGYGSYGYGPYGYGYPPIYRYEELGGCRLARQRIRTAKGWRVRNVDVCE
jgi:hypothetical protein